MFNPYVNSPCRILLPYNKDTLLQFSNIASERYDIINEIYTLIKAATDFVKTKREI